MFVLIAFITCVLAATPVIDSVLASPSPANRGPDYLYVKVKPQKNVPNTLYMKVAGTGSDGSFYPEQVWVGANMTDFTASWKFSYSVVNPAPLVWRRSYNFAASFDAQNWSPQFAVGSCCERVRPANQTTIVLSGNITQDIVETENKIRITNSAIISRHVMISSWWEIELEDQLHVLAAPSESYEPSIGIRAGTPINVTGVTVRVDFDPNFRGEEVYHVRVLSQFLALVPVAGNFPEPFSLSGKSPLCAFEGGIISYGDPSWEPRDAGLYLNFTCPPCEVHSWDFLYLPFLILIPIALGIIYVLYRQQKYSTWQLVNRGFAIFFVTIIFVAMALEGLLQVNYHRGETALFCYRNEIMQPARDAQIHALPIVAGLSCIGFGILWFNVIVFSFPRENSKSSERFCANYSLNKRIAWYFGLWLLLLAIFFFVLWTPLWFLWDDMEGFNSAILMSLVVGPIFGAAAGVIVISWICLTTCCRNEKFDWYFKDSSADYMTVMGGEY